MLSVPVVEVWCFFLEEEGLEGTFVDSLNDNKNRKGIRHKAKRSDSTILFDPYLQIRCVIGSYLQVLDSQAAPFLVQSSDATAQELL